MKLLLIAMTLLVCGISELAAQPRSIPRVFTYTKQTTNTETITIQQPASGAKVVQLKSATVHCSVACTIEQFRNGTAATGTAGTVSKNNPETTPTVSVFHTSDTNTASAQVLPTIDHPGNYPMTLELEDVYLFSGGTSQNYTIKVTITGTVRITLKWQEF
jgi:hypothetical protein